MNSNVTKGAKVGGLLVYLAGPGKANEHSNPHVVGGSDVMMLFAPEGQLSRDSALMLARELDSARKAFGVEVTTVSKKAAAALRAQGMTATMAVEKATSVENVWHCSLSLHTEEAPLSDEQWEKIAGRFMEMMELDVPGDPRPPVRWVAVRHGLSERGNDHIHIAASTVREDGTKANLWQDYTRTQKACRDLEVEFGLRVTTGRAAKLTEPGRSPAQEEIAARTGRRETAKATLARRVRAVAGAAESEAEFVRLARAHGLLVRPRYKAGSKTDVVGYSVALPTADYATRDGHPVWHGGGKLGNDLTLPRLRERWAAPDPGARADAVSAWAHHQRETIDPTAAAMPAAAEQARAGMSFKQAREQLRVTLLTAAKGASTERDFIQAARDKGVLLRPRYAPGTTDKVTGYSAALPSHMYSDRDGHPVWHGGGKLDNALTLSELRRQWPPMGTYGPEGSMTVKAWARVAPDAARNAQASAEAKGWAAAARSARRWQQQVNKLGDSGERRGTATWARAAHDTAAAMSAWSTTVEGDCPAELARMADALSAAAGDHRSPAQARSDNPGASMRRVAAMMLAASGDDPRYLWMAVFSQLAATSRAISAALEAEGHAQRARELAAATAAASAKFDTIAADADSERVRANLAAAAAGPASTQRPSSPAPQAPPANRDHYQRPPERDDYSR
ncbi:relaxase/mobilization nuclease domain-containing protein [Williamsia muralis]|uniref:Relaxase n=1 Tax=Williamsia marianensis TaxID=85044 RepID=A0ABU4F081_WILMA|nr:relaxase/mobilization nuclease domain-containing protein [Williamsia muralis]MDV7136907.1 relaxase [Williamsia muralis]